MNKCSVTFTCDLVVRHGVLLGHELLRTKAMVHLCVLTLNSVPYTPQVLGHPVEGLANGVNGSAQ